MLNLSLSKNTSKNYVLSNSVRKSIMTDLLAKCNAIGISDPHSISKPGGNIRQNAIC